MTRLHRWRLAVPLFAVSLLCLGATGAGAWAYWSGDTTVERALTVVLLALFAGSAAVSVSIGVSRPTDDEAPWRRIGATVVLLVVGWGVALLRRSLY